VRRRSADLPLPLVIDVVSGERDPFAVAATISG